MAYPLVGPWERVLKDFFVIFLIFQRKNVSRRETCGQPIGILSVTTLGIGPVSSFLSSKSTPGTPYDLANRYAF